MFSAAKPGPAGIKHLVICNLDLIYSEDALITTFIATIYKVIFLLYQNAVIKSHYFKGLQYL